MSQLFRNLFAARNFTKLALNSALNQTSLFKPVLSAANSANSVRYYVKNSPPIGSDLNEALKLRNELDEERPKRQSSNNWRQNYRENSMDRFKKFNNSDNFRENRSFRDNNFRDNKRTLYRKPADESLLEANSAPIETSGEASDYGSQADFASFDIPKVLLERLKALGYLKPFEIQSETLKHSLLGKDLVGKAFTGSGKTLAFAIPIVSKIYNSKIQELAPELKTLAIYGGTDYDSQTKPLSQKVDIVCATPGRLKDLLNRKNFITDDIEIICLDEADELLTPNFMEQITDIIRSAKETKQMLLFSATISKSVTEVIKEHMKEPVFVDLTKGQKHKLPSNITHFITKVNQNDISEAIKKLIAQFKSERCIVFVSKKVTAMRFNDDLRQMGVRSMDLHGDVSQRKRQWILEDFRRGKLSTIVATDVAARGIDIPEINLVIHVGFPPNGIDYYIHRSGRCGRAGRAGNSVVIHDGSYNSVLREMFSVIKFKDVEIEGIEFKESEVARFGDDEYRPRARSYSSSSSSYDRNNSFSPYLRKKYQSNRSDNNNENFSRYENKHSNNFNKRSNSFNRNDNDDFDMQDR